MTIEIVELAGGFRWFTTASRYILFMSLVEWKNVLPCPALSCLVMLCWIKLYPGE